MKQLNKAFLFATMAGAMYKQAVVDENSNPAGAPVVNPPVVPKTEAEIAQEAAEKAAKLEAIKAKFNNLVDIKESNFHFRKVTDEKTKITTKRPTVYLPVPVPSLDGIIDILSKGPGKETDLLLEAVASVIMEQAREYVNDNETVNEDNFPYEILDWTKIANLPKAERRGGGISKEVWEDFALDYVAIMPGVTGKTKEQVDMAAKVFVSKFANAKTNKPVLKVLQQQLTVYTNATTRGEEFTGCIEFLSNKLEALLNSDETNLLLAL